MKILIAEDDPVTIDAIDESLRSEGFETVLAKNGCLAIELWRREKPDLVCLDIMMPEIDGYEVCRTIRATDPKLPVLFLSAKNEEIDVVVGLEIGADDFIRKPFGKFELLARVRSALRRASPKASSPKSFQIDPDLTVYPSRLYAVRHSGEEIDLTPRDISILQLLHEHRGEAVHRDDLLEHCWGMQYFPESRSLDQHISKLRKRIETDPTEPTIIETVRSVGYRMREFSLNT